LIARPSVARPGSAAQLLKEGNPANRAALARRKMLLGNEASHLADMLDGEQKT
jgi:hypothetical protein